MARAALASGDGSPEQRGRSGLRFRVRTNVTLTDDTLILLSLDSPDLEARVDEYRHALRGGRAETASEKDG